MVTIAVSWRAGGGRFSTESPTLKRPMVILVNGAGPGLGKTTLSDTLCRELAERAAVELFGEADILTRPEFAAVIEEFQTRPRVELATLLDATRLYLAECIRRGHDFYVLDALLPYWLSVEAWGYSDVELGGFLSNLSELAGPIAMIEIYVEGDLNDSLSRAALREGPGWIESQIAKIRSFPNAHPPADVGQVAAYYRATADRRRRFLETVGWPIHVVNAGDGPEAMLQQALAFINSQRLKMTRQ